MNKGKLIFENASIKGATLAQIAYELGEIQGNSVFLQAIQAGTKSNVPEVIKMIKGQAEDNYALVEHIVGKDLLLKIMNV